MSDWYRPSAIVQMCLYYYIEIKRDVVNEKHEQGVMYSELVILNSSENIIFKEQHENSINGNDSLLAQSSHFVMVWQCWV